MSFGNIELWAAFLTNLAITGVYLAVVVATGEIPRASEVFGHGLGIVGFILMLMTETLYSIRKRTRVARWGRMAYWLKFHIFTGLVGPSHRGGAADGPPVPRDVAVGASPGGRVLPLAVVAGKAPPGTAGARGGQEAGPASGTTSCPAPPAGSSPWPSCTFAPRCITPPCCAEEGSHDATPGLSHPSWPSGGLRGPGRGGGDYGGEGRCALQSRAPQRPDRGAEGRGPLPRGNPGMRTLPRAFLERGHHGGPVYGLSHPGSGRNPEQPGPARPLGQGPGTPFLPHLPYGTPGTPGRADHSGPGHLPPRGGGLFPSGPSGVAIGTALRVHGLSRAAFDGLRTRNLCGVSPGPGCGLRSGPSTGLRGGLPGLPRRGGPLLRFRAQPGYRFPPGRGPCARGLCGLPSRGHHPGGLAGDPQHLFRLPSAGRRSPGPLWAAL